MESGPPEPEGVDEVPSAGRTRRKAKYSVLLLTLVFLVVLKPLVPHFWGAIYLLDAGLVLILVACVAVLGQTRHRLIVAAALCLVPLAAVMLPKGDLSMIPLRGLFVVAFLVYATVLILIDVFSGSEATADKLLGSICAYLLVGICFGMGYLAIDLLHPGAFSFDGVLTKSPVAHHEVLEKFSHYFYFSFTTMSTVGFGDILPIRPSARSLVIAQAVFGQFYMALLVGRLLALHVQSHRSDRL